MSSLQVPLFLQGLLLHSSMSVKYFVENISIFSLIASFLTNRVVNGNWFAIQTIPWSPLQLFFEHSNICESNLNMILMLIVVSRTFNSSSANNNFTSIFINGYLFHNFVQQIQRDMYRYTSLCHHCKFHRFGKGYFYIHQCL